MDYILRETIDCIWITRPRGFNVNDRPSLFKTFILPVFFNSVAVIFGLFLTATPYLAEFYVNHPEFKAGVFLLGPAIVVIALVNMMFATLNSVKHMGSRPSDGV